MSNILIVLIIINLCASFINCFSSKSKRGGLSSTFGGGGNQIMGAKKTTDFLEKATWTLVIILIILSLATNYVAISKSKNSNGAKGMTTNNPVTKIRIHHQQ